MIWLYMSVKRGTSSFTMIRKYPFSKGGEIFPICAFDFLMLKLGNPPWKIGSAGQLERKKRSKLERKGNRTVQALSGSKRFNWTLDLMGSKIAQPWKIGRFCINLRATKLFLYLLSTTSFFSYFSSCKSRWENAVQDTYWRFPLQVSTPTTTTRPLLNRDTLRIN